MLLLKDLLKQAASCLRGSDFPCLPRDPPRAGAGITHLDPVLTKLLSLETAVLLT